VILLSDKTIKLWKVSERDKKAEGYNLKEDSGLLRDPSTINTLRVSAKVNSAQWLKRY
jgi:serine/threonine-protein phosphatase 2A regulatory subunit B